VSLGDAAGELLAEILGVVAAGAGDAEKRELLGGEELVDECVVSGAAGLTGGGSIELDATNNAACFVLGEDEADVLVRDQAVGGLATAFGPDFEEVSEGNFDRDPADGADEWFENREEFLLGPNQEVLVRLHEVRENRGGAQGGIEDRRAAVLSSEHPADREREQGGADEETEDEIRAQ
jgi:hypothetical protein